MNEEIKEKEKINPLLASQQQQSLGDYVRGYFQRLASGDLGSLPIIIGLLVIAIIFQSANQNFLTPRNFVNLILQMSGTTMIAYGVVFVLLLGDIDLSIGYVSAVGGVSVAILLKVTDVMGLFADGAIPDSLPPQAIFFLLIRGLGLFLLPLMLGGGRLIWYSVRHSKQAMRAFIAFSGSLFVFLVMFFIVGIIKNPLLARIMIGIPVLAMIITLPVLAFFTLKTIFAAEQKAELFLQAFFLALCGIGIWSLFYFANGWTWYNAAAIALITTALIGLLHGFIITFFRVPSFIVTLAGLLAWNGVVLKIIGGGGTVIVQDDVIEGIANSYLPVVDPSSVIVVPAGQVHPNDIILGGFNFGHPVLSWGLIVLLACVLGFALVQLLQYNSRKSQGLSTVPVAVILTQIVGLSIIAVLVAHISDQDRGVPIVGLILMLFLVFLNFVANNTQFGRFVYAVGGNAEAARRAGINVTQIRMIVFMISSVMACLGGIVLASRLRSVDTNAGGGNLLLNSVASAVIGGTSLFGGRGHVASAVLGALVIIGVDNGMGLLNLSSGDKFIITGIVLIVAVVVDALSQRRQQQSGLR